MPDPIELFFPQQVDSTIMATLRSCPMKLRRTYLEHWKPKYESVHLVAGGAFAAGLEVARRCYYEGGEGTIGGETLQIEPGDAERAVAAGLFALIQHYGDFEPPEGSAKTLDRMCGAFEFYFDRYPLGQDGTSPLLLPNGKRAIEFSFALPLPFNHPVTGNPVLYTGRADMVCEFAGGIYVVDDKTTSSLGPSWAKQWEMRSQFTGYNWACREYGIETAGSMVSGVSILKTRYDTQRHVTYRSPYEIDRWLEQTVRDLERLQRMFESGWFDYALDGACAEYGGCGFLNVCKSPSPEDWLPTYFAKKVWDPLARKEVSVEEWRTVQIEEGNRPYTITG